MIYTATITNGRLPGIIAQQIAHDIGNLDGRKVSITLKEYKRKRSLNQNNYYWGVVVQRVLVMFRENGNIVDAEQVHDFLRAHVARMVTPVVLPDGEVKNVLRSTASLTTAEFEDYMEQIRAWAAQFNMIIPQPNEEL